MTTTPLPFSDPAAAAEGATGRKRDSLFLLARLRIAVEAKEHEVRIRNLSEGGLMAEFERPVAVDTEVTCELRGVGVVAGRVVWCERQRLGIAFDQPIDPKLARKPVGQGTRTPFYAKAAPTGR